MRQFVKLLLRSATLKDALLLQIGNGLSAALNLIIAVILARSLFPEDLGFVITGLTFIQLASDMFELGINAAVFNFVSSSSDTIKFSFVRTTFVYKLLISLVLSGMVFVFHSNIAAFLSQDQLMDSFIKFSSLGIFLTMIITWGQTVLQAERRFLSYVLNSLSLNIFRILAVLVLLSVGLLNRYTAFVSLILVQVLTLISLFRLIKFDFIWASVKKKTALDVLKFGFPVGVGFAFWSVYTRLDQILIFKIAGTEEAGIYGLAYRIASVILLIASALGTTITPRFASLTDSVFYGYFKLISVGTLSLSLFLIFLVLVSPFTFPLIFGSRFDASIAPFKILAVGLIFFLLSIPFNNAVLYKFKRPSFIMWSSAVYLLIVWWLLNYLIPIYGSVGAAVAVAIMYFVQMILSVGYFLYLKRTTFQNS